jgi:hypothetical protein
MKNKTITLIATVAALMFGLTACKDSHEGHDHDGHEEHADHKEDHKDHKGHDHEKHKEGEHGEHAKKAGPNGGRLIHSIEPHAELVVLDDRRVKVNFLDDDLKPVPAGDQVVSLMGGDRSAPFRLAFAKEGNSLLSDKAIPAGDDHPAVLQIKANADAKATIEKFHLNLSACPTCKYKEYACICEHGDHDHKETEKK